jgi:hypothetical protein
MPGSDFSHFCALSCFLLASFSFAPAASTRTLHALPHLARRVLKPVHNGPRGNLAGYRNASILMHAGIAATDALDALSHDNARTALSSLSGRGVPLSLGALIEQTSSLWGLARQSVIVILGGLLSQSCHQLRTSGRGKRRSAKAGQITPRVPGDRNNTPGPSCTLNQ